VGIPLKEAVSDKRAASVAEWSPKEPAEVPPASPTTPSQSLREEMRQQIEPPPPSPEAFGALARHAPRQVSSPSHRMVTATLPADLYEQLQQEAQRRRISVITILREAVEAYAQSHKRED
jgi:hypothetical protein